VGATWKGVSLLHSYYFPKQLQSVTDVAGTAGQISYNKIN
jgi:hypothetical protein